MTAFVGQSEQRRRMGLVLDALAAQKTYDADLYACAISWLKGDMARAAADECDDLFPLLQSRAQRRDDFGTVLNRLSQSHDGSAALARRILPMLEGLRLAGQPASRDAGLVTLLKDLAARERQHAALVLAVVLPIARLRLKASDLAALAAAHDRRRQGTKPPS